jgi:RNA polymerase sigma-70 factor (ECF subfamily)
MIKKKRIYLNKDTRLILKAAGGDEEAFERLYRKYFPIITSYATSVNGNNSSSEDIANEVFSRVWKQRAKYQPASTVKTYLLGFAKIIIREYRRQLHKHLPIYASHFELMEDLSDPANMSQHQELSNLIERAKSKLSEKQLQTLELTFYSNVSIDEAAKLAVCSKSVFCHRVYDVKKRLSALLGHIRQY